MKKSIFCLLAISTFLCSSYVIAACNSYDESTPTGDFTLDGATALHHKTGLTWQRCGVGQTWDDSTGSCTGSLTTFTWKEALEEAAKPANDGWRLPNIKELATIVEHNCHQPAINEVVFPNTLFNYYWTMSPSMRQPTHAWGVHFREGVAGSNAKNSVAINNSNVSIHVRLVKE